MRRTPVSSRSVGSDPSEQEPDRPAAASTETRVPVRRLRLVRGLLLALRVGPALVLLLLVGVLSLLSPVFATTQNLGNVALDAAQGKSVQANVDTGTEIVTKDNASQFG